MATRGAGIFRAIVLPHPRGSFRRRDVAAGDPAYRLYLDAIRTHESLDGRILVGDGGKSLGPLHMTHECWVDGCKVLGIRLPWWPFVFSRRHSERVITAYYARYATAALLGGDWATLARVHNGGPFSRKGPDDPNTLAYWRSIEAIMAGTDPPAKDPEQSPSGKNWHEGVRAAEPTPAYRFRRFGGRRATMHAAEAKEFYWEADTPLFVDREYD